MTHQVAMTVDAKLVVRTARELWCEDRVSTAFELLYDGIPGLTYEQVFGILSGELTLEGTTEYKLLSDGVTDYEGIPLRSLRDMLVHLERKFKDLKADTNVILEYAYDNTHYVSSPRGLLRVPASWTTWITKEGTLGGGYHALKLLDDETIDEALARVLRWFPDAATTISDEPDSVACQVWSSSRERYAANHPDEENDPIGDSLQARIEENFEDLLKSFSEIVYKLNDKEFTYRNGFILPDGTFHGCEFMKHREILTALGLDVIEHPKDWVLVRDEDMRIRLDLPSLSESGYFSWPSFPTQAQIDTAFDWAIAHDVDFEAPEG